MKQQIRIPIYNTNVTLYKDTPLSEVGEENGIYDLDGYSGGVFKCVEDDIIEYLLVLEEDWDYGILSHECLHLTNYILDDCGVQPSFRDDESQAYLLKYIVNKVVEFYEEDSN